MKNAPYSMRFSEAEQNAIAAYCAQNSIPVPEQAADVKNLFMQVIAKPSPASSAPAEESEVYLTLQADFNQLQEKYSEVERRTAACAEKNELTAAEQAQELEARNLRIAELEEQVRMLAATDENTLVVPLLPNVKMLLDMTCARLSEKYAHKYPNGVTPAMILVDMFLRYTRDQYTEWFYPFVIAPSEAKAILKGE